MNILRYVAETTYDLLGSALGERDETIAEQAKIRIAEAKYKLFRGKEIRIGGLSISYGTFHDFQATYREIFATKAYDRIFDHVKGDAPVVLDLGCNIGFFALRVLQRYPNARIACYDAQETAIDIAKENLKNYPAAVVEFYHNAVGGADGTLTIYTYPDHDARASAGVRPREGETAREAAVQCTRLSSMLRDAKHVDLIKMDIEGMEAPALQDAYDSGTLDKVDNIVLEYHSTEDCMSVYPLLIHAGYRVTMYNPNIESDMGMLYAWREP